METKMTENAVSPESVALRAYERYVERGREDGHDVEDWLAAEQEIQETASGSPLPAGPAH